MKTFINLIVIFSVGYAAYLLVPSFHAWFGVEFMVSRNNTTYWGWFDWLTVLDWVPRLLMGFVTGLCAALLCRGEYPHLWALACGILLMLATFTTTGETWAVDIPPLQKTFQNLWPLMYPIGTFLGGILVVAVIRSLDRSDD